MPIGPARMPIMDHLGELRRRLTIIVVAVVVCALIVYFATPTLIELMIGQISDAMNGAELVVTTVLGGFTIRFKVALFFSVIICCPIIIWEIMAFFLPALKPKERRWVVPTVAAMVLLFFLGMVFCFFIIQPAAFGWLLEQSLEIGALMPEASDYLDIYMLLEIGFGIAFQLPLFMVLSAVVTPDASPVTMVLMFAILILLYEAALAVSRFIIVARDGREALKWGREDFENRKLDQE